MIEITIDGQKVEVREGSMVMDAANQLGTYIPHFCYHKKLSIAANCRMCLVDVEKAPKPLPACATPVTAGMIVHTHSEKAVKAQKGVMEFLLINHPLDCPICDQGGECQLQDLAVGYGGSASRYAEEKRVVFHKNVGPLISMEEMTRCIHCTRCVRFGQEIAGVMELGMLNRGEHAEITTFVGKTVDSELSGNMIDICPVGALTSKPFRYSARTWELARRRSISPHDSLGANLVVQVKGNKVLRVVPMENEEINECWISDKDRFSYEGLNGASRLTRPMIKQGGGWQTVEWQVALEYVAKGILQIVKDHGPDALGALATPHSTLEELYLLQKLVRGMGSENVDTRLRQVDFALDRSGPSAPWLGMTIRDVSMLDRVLVIGSFLRKDHPLLTQRLRQAAKRGASVSLMHACDEELLMPVANKLIVRPSQWQRALGQIATAIARQKGVNSPLEIEPEEHAKAIANSLLTGQRKAVLLGNSAVHHPSYSQLAVLAQWIAQHTEAKLGVLTEAANTVGSHVARAYPGKNGRHVASQLEKPCKAYLLWNAESALDFAKPVEVRAALRAAEMVVSFSPFQDAASDDADVILPIAPFTETSGTFVNAEARAQSFNGVVRPLGETRPGWKVLRVLGNLLGLSGFDYETSEQVRDEVTGGKLDLSSVCSNVVDCTIDAPAESHPAIERIADVPIYSADALVRRAASLQLTRDAQLPRIRVNATLAAQLGLQAGRPVRVRQQGQQVDLECVIDPCVADGTARIACGHASTSLLASQFGELTLEPLEHA